MRRSVLTTVLAGLLATTGLRAQTVLHTSYEDYLQHKGDSLGDFVDAYPVLGHFVLVFHTADGTAERKVNTRRLWGFTYKNVLFRIARQEHMPVRLMTRGSICYYENGLAHLEMQRDHTESAFFADGERSYVSKDLQSEIVPAHFAANDHRSPSARFAREHPEYATVCTCIGEQEDMDRTRQCVVDFEVAEEDRH